MSLKIYFLRHGETIYSKNGGYCGELDPELTPEGLKMAEIFAEAYSSVSWQGIFVSPMKRTIATAKPLCEAVGMAMQLRDELKELKFGSWEGLTTEEIEEKYPQDYIHWLSEPAWNPPTGGETGVQLANRATKAIAEIESKYSDGNILVVSHKATIRILLCSLLGIDLGRYRDRLNVLVGSVNLVRFDIHGPMLEILGDRSYLPEDLRNLYEQ
jgi:broad specificity phosphatase PhoE